MADTIKTNRAPILTLRAAVIAERLGFDWQEALTLGRAVAGLEKNAYGTLTAIAAGVLGSGLQTLCQGLDKY